MGSMQVLWRAAFNKLDAQDKSMFVEDYKWRDLPGDDTGNGDSEEVKQFKAQRAASTADIRKWNEEHDELLRRRDGFKRRAEELGLEFIVRS